VVQTAVKKTECGRVTRLDESKTSIKPNHFLLQTPQQSSPRELCGIGITMVLYGEVHRTDVLRHDVGCEWVTRS
jgi:hypothetical protein